MQLALVKGLLQGFEEEAPEEAGEHADGQEEARTAGDPPLAIRTEAPTRAAVRLGGLGATSRGPATGTWDNGDCGSCHRRVAAGVTLLQVTAQGGGTAEFNGAHHAPLPA